MKFYTFNILLISFFQYSSRGKMMRFQKQFVENVNSNSSKRLASFTTPKILNKFWIHVLALVRRLKLKRFIWTKSHHIWLKCWTTMEKLLKMNTTTKSCLNRTIRKVIRKMLFHFWKMLNETTLLVIHPRRLNKKRLERITHVIIAKKGTNCWHRLYTHHNNLYFIFIIDSYESQI